MMNKILLHLEGLAVFVLCIYVYRYYELSWLLFFILLFAPDISMLGYFINKKIGAVVYNIFHTYTISIPVTVFGFLSSQPFIFEVGLIWTAHIGMDRLFGFGLKYPTDFKDTHLNRV